ncbi:hypothetical protein LJ737_23990 [Hymenobacter sp. 15J16-1T3B]|nr:hypothetical protein [Hymenobacter sp. 15J16-1T3B]MCC3160320.1 hypothetical protein [Hymenobacter sp. 15J16-1T3B]
MVPLDEIMTHPGNYQPPRRFTIAECLLYCDTWEVELLNAPSAYRILNTYRGQQVVLTTSLASFLQHFLRGGVYAANGLYAWAERLLAGG